MENYFGSQQHWEDNINADYDERERHNAEQVDNRTQPDPREQQQEEACGGNKPDASENTLPIQNVVGSACFHPMQSRVRTHRGEHCGDCGKRF